MVTIKKNLGCKFDTRVQAVHALQDLEFWFATDDDYPIVTTYMNQYSLELEVHFTNRMPRIPWSFLVSKTEIRSYDRENGRLRVKTFYFEY